MSYSCQILADSLSVHGDRLTTMKITFPRFILAEFNTHRMFSRNSASSRAIPFKRMVQMVKENPFIPIAFQKDHSGMQGTEYHNERDTEVAISAHLVARNKAIEQAEYLNSKNVTKQLCNRLLEPFMWHTVIVTATEWENFFNLRCPQYKIGNRFFRSKNDCLNSYLDEVHPYNVHKKQQQDKILNAPKIDDALAWLQVNESQAEIHIQAIAELMWDAMNESKPKQLQPGEWHIPYGDRIDLESTAKNEKGEELRESFRTYFAKRKIDIPEVKIASARGARVSYETLGNNPKIDYNADIKLHDILLENGHGSPLEHCGKCPERNQDFDDSAWEDGFTHKDVDDNLWSGNFKGWIQYRQLIQKK